MAIVASPADIQQLATLSIPTRDQVRIAASAIPSAPYDPLRHASGPRWYLHVTAGTVALRHTDKARLARSREDAFRRQARTVDAIVQEERMRLNEPMALVDMPRVSLPPNRSGARIDSWTRRSRARMELALRAFDYSPMFLDGRVPVMVTLTMPGEGWEQLVPTPRRFKRMIVKFQEYWHRAWGARPVGVWKLEYQRRGAPHLHVLVVPPLGVSADRLRADFRTWLSKVWARIVRHPDPVEYAKHERAGTTITPVIERYRDPKRIAQYFSKHGAYASKGYQNQMPELWREAIASGEAGARFWGYWGLRKTGAEVELSEAPRVDETEHYRQSWEVEDTASWATDRSVLRAAARDAQSFASDRVRVERYLRKLARSLAAKRHDGRVVQKVNKRGQLVTSMRIRVIRGYRVIDHDTGEVARYRSYRVGYYTGGAGFLSVNDGTRTADDIARLLGGTPASSQSSWVLSA